MVSSQDASTSSRGPAHDFSSLRSPRAIQDLPLPKTGKALAAVMSGIRETYENNGNDLFPCAVGFSPRGSLLISAAVMHALHMLRNLTMQLACLGHCMSQRLLL